MERGPTEHLSFPGNVEKPLAWDVTVPDTYATSHIMTDLTLFTFPAATAFASGKIIICEMRVERLADAWIATSSSMFAHAWPGFHKFSRGPSIMTFFTGSLASGWTRSFRLDYVELP